MPNQPSISFPGDYATVPVTHNPRIFIAQGQVVLDSGSFAVGVNGHLLTAGKKTVKAVGSLIAWSQVGPQENTFQWALLFVIGTDSAVPDGPYDLLVSTYTGSTTIKTATENCSSSQSNGVTLVTLRAPGVTLIPLAIGLTTPTTPGPINRNMFMPYGSYTDDHKPDQAGMTETTTGKHFTGNVFGSGSPNGAWYAGFGPIDAGGTYTLDVSSSVGTGASISVTGLTT